MALPKTLKQIIRVSDSCCIILANQYELKVSRRQFAEAISEDGQWRITYNAQQSKVTASWISGSYAGVDAGIEYVANTMCEDCGKYYDSSHGSPTPIERYDWANESGCCDDCYARIMAQTEHLLR